MNVLFERQKEKGFSLIELIVVVSVIAVISTVILPMMMDMAGTGRIVTEQRNIQLWNGVYLDAYAVEPALAAVNDWNAISTRMAAGVTSDLGEGEVTFACQPPVFINVGDPDFVPGRGITAAPAP